MSQKGLICPTITSSIHHIFVSSRDQTPYYSFDDRILKFQIMEMLPKYQKTSINTFQGKSKIITDENQGISFRPGLNQGKSKIFL